MTTGNRLVWLRRAFLRAGSFGLLGFAVLGQAAHAAVGPDVVVWEISGVGNYTPPADGFAAYSIGTTSCNRGDAPLNWCDQATGCAPGAKAYDHPVIGQNLYRLKDGRFQQIGMSWLKHGFVSTNTPQATCAGAQGQSCQSPPFGGNQLGVGCTDPYGSGLNGSRPLGPRSEVNPTTGAYPFPFTAFSPQKVYDQRIKVATTDVDPTLNPGALYFGEAQYIAPDDAMSGNSLNNASYRRVNVGGSPNFNITITAATVEQQPAIFAWKAQDSTVTVDNVDLPTTPVQRFQVARKVTQPFNGVWHYEYAVRNHNAAAGARSFTVRFEAPTNLSGFGFSSIDSHSGEPYSNAVWSRTTTADSVTWFTDDFATDPNANAIRYATMYNFWFDADRPPSGELNTIGLFNPPAEPVITEVTFLVNGGLFFNGFEVGDASRWSGHDPVDGSDTTSWAER